MGFSSIAANALSMGVGEYLSSKAHREFIQVEKRRETWEFKHFKDVEIREVKVNAFSCRFFWPHILDMYDLSFETFLRPSLSYV